MVGQRILIAILTVCCLASVAVNIGCATQGDRAENSIGHPKSLIARSGQKAILAPAPAPKPKLAADPSHRCVGDWGYVPENLNAEVGFSVHIPVKGEAVVQLSDYDKVTSQPRSVGDPTLVRLVDRISPAEPIFLICSLEGRVTAAILNGRGYVLQRIKGNVFDVARARGHPLEE